MADLITPYATRLCFSGLESRRLLDTFAEFGVPHIQVSYYYLQRVFPDPAELEKFIQPFKTVIIDTGTVFGGFKTDEAKKQFLQDYAGYIGGLNKRAFTAAVMEKGVLLDGVLPEEALIYPLDDLREVFDNDMRAIFDNVKYVGVGTKRGKEDDMHPIFAAARKRGAWIHAFGTASKAFLMKFPFYTANSSSWRSGSRYLNTYIYEGPSRGLKLIQPTDKSDEDKTQRQLGTARRRQKNLVSVRQPNIAPLINWGEVDEGDSWEVDKANLSQWLLYQRDLELMGHNKYYLDDTAKQQLIQRKRDLYGSSGSRGANSSGRVSDASNNQRNTPPLDIEGGVYTGGRIEVPGIALPGAYNQYREEGRETRSDMEEGNNSNKEATYMAGGGGFLDSTPPDIEGEEVVEAEVVEEGAILDTAVRENEDSPRTTYTSTDLVPRTISGDIGAPLPMKTPAHPADERLFARRECDFCSMQGRCPRYEPGAECAYGYTAEEQYDVNKLEDHIYTDASRLLQLQMERIAHGAMEERKDGAGVSKDLNREIKTYMELVQLLAEATDKRDEVTVRAKGTGALEALMSRNKSK